MIWLTLLLACGPEEGDSAEPEVIVTYEPVEGEGCDAVTMRVDGADPPVVGDTWTVWLYCDDALLTGAAVLQVDPPSLATIEDNRATFVETGAGTVRLQVGSRRGEQAVKVGAAR